MANWLENLKQGDTVITVNGNGSRGLDTVARLTATQIILRINSTRRFRRSTGSQVGGGTWSSWLIVEATPQAVREVRDNERERRLVRRLSDTRWSDYPVSTLEAIAALLDTPKEG